MMPSAGEKIAVGVEKIGMGLKRFGEGLIFSGFFFFIPSLFLLWFGNPYTGVDIVLILEVAAVFTIIFSVLCGISIRFLALMCSLMLACLPALIVGCVAGNFTAQRIIAPGSSPPTEVTAFNTWVAVPVYIILLLLIFPWIWIYLLHKHGLLTKKTDEAAAAGGGVISTIRNEFVDTAREIKKFGRR
ncbi:MAG: hypothetical protein L6408_02130 [Nanoarchaeota archaeon]|nr:hypothetical protein [Nanoarchaeota archaeon]